MHQAAEASFYQAVKAGGKGPVLVDLAALLLERAHLEVANPNPDPNPNPNPNLEAAKRPAAPEGVVAREVGTLCLGNGYNCHPTGLRPPEVWKRDDVRLEMVKQVVKEPLSKPGVQP